MASSALRTVVVSTRPLLQFRAATVGALQFSTTTPAAGEKKHYKLCIVGGGAAGISNGSKFGRKLGKGNVCIVEPSEVHYYQPMWTLVGGGVKSFTQSGKAMADVMPLTVDWIKAGAEEFSPDNNLVRCSDGTEITYDYLIVAMGLSLQYEKIKGLPEAFQYDGVGSNFSAKYVEKTFRAIQNFKGGNAIFTFPNTPIKCAGAPQKIMYLADDFWTRNNVRDKANISYNTALPVVFGVKKYAEILAKLCERRNLKINYRHNLVEVIPDKKEAVFEHLDTGEKITFPYDMIHITPPMGPPELLKKSPLADAVGWVDVDKQTLQHVRYPNVFSTGDCSSLPTSKTAAAVAAQCGILYNNLSAIMDSQEPQKKYDGYTSCPLVTRKGKCILAEFDYDLQPLETFPVDQGKERRTMWHLKANVMPELYWTGLLKGRWSGPGFYRKAMRLGMGK
ncbi:PREDICTED: sulfide:quinone oxidoreductase, mitochondrial-like [Branchiostoma belcheri]|uniref:Sulfide:quinone oxidoreductase, mitochondrial n=1 Tax=Branchiostoma belcheri TaxID=7741 RepID=A0A6P4Y1S4_BRABE|nr:PREDICTED: sulfide:quinone oxidoreductase, mitochondrial-like [Branchiostoma belcheri]